MDEVEERREDLEFGDVSREPDGSSAKSNGESDRLRLSESPGPRFAVVELSVKGRAIGMPYGSDFALVRPLRPIVMLEETRLNGIILLTALGRT